MSKTSKRVPSCLSLDSDDHLVLKAVSRNFVFKKQTVTFEVEKDKNIEDRCGQVVMIQPCMNSKEFVPAIILAMCESGLHSAISKFNFQNVIYVKDSGRPILGLPQPLPGMNAIGGYQTTQPLSTYHILKLGQFNSVEIASSAMNDNYDLIDFLASIHAVYCQVDESSLPSSYGHFQYTNGIFLEILGKVVTKNKVLHRQLLEVNGQFMMDHLELDMAWPIHNSFAEIGVQVTKMSEVIKTIVKNYDTYVQELKG